MGGAVAALGNAASSVGSAVAGGAQTLGSSIASGAKALYGDEKNYLQSGSPTDAGQQPTMGQSLLYGQQQPQQSGPTPAQQLRRNSLANY